MAEECREAGRKGAKGSELERQGGILIDAAETQRGISGRSSEWRQQRGRSERLPEKQRSSETNAKICRGVQVTRCREISKSRLQIERPIGR